MIAYTYVVRHKLSKKFYYGVRKSPTFDLFVDYFTSSKIIKKLIQTEGLEQFEIKLMRKFNSYEDARRWETNFLKKIGVPNNNRCYNQAVSSPRHCSQDSYAEEKRKISISRAMKLRWEDPSYKAYMAEKARTNNNLKNVNSRCGGRKPFVGPKQPKPRNKQKYKNIEIQKNDIKKIIAANQYPQYRKYGWNKVVPVAGIEPALRSNQELSGV